MSTILKTLRKLEEEKSILDQKLDLKEMLLKEDAVFPKSIKPDRHNLFLLIAMVMGLLIAGGTAFYHWWAPNYEVPSLPKHAPNKIPPQQTPLFKDSSRLRTFEGVPMAAISRSSRIRCCRNLIPPAAACWKISMIAGCWNER